MIIIKPSYYQFFKYHIIIIPLQNIAFNELANIEIIHIK